MRWWYCSDGLSNGPSRGGIALLDPSIHHLTQLGRQWKGGVLDLKERVLHGWYMSCTMLTSID